MTNISKRSDHWQALNTLVSALMLMAVTRQKSIVYCLPVFSWQLTRSDHRV
jgi:hypothetical protein